METKDYKTKTGARKSESFLRHRRQRFWQIWLPLIIFTLIILGAAVLMVLTVTGVETGIGLSQYSDVSLIWIILPLFLIAVVVLAVLVGLIVVNGKILANLPRFAYPVQETVKKVSQRVGSITRKMVNPIISLKSLGAGISQALSSISGIFKK